jgi:hypothetical protein
MVRYEFQVVFNFEAVTFNISLSFIGTAAQVKRRNRKFFDYRFGNVGVITPRPIGNHRAFSPQDFVAVMPLDKFVVAFGSHKEMAKRLEAKAEEVVKLWHDINAKKKPGKRESVDRRYPLFKHIWRDGAGREEISSQELWLNTHSFTTDNMFAKVPRVMTLEDVRVIALRKAL